jgi:hypothetical protein
MVQATFPLTQAGAAQQKLENEHTQGKTRRSYKPWMRRKVLRQPANPYSKGMI